MVHPTFNSDIELRPAFKHGNNRCRRHGCTDNDATIMPYLAIFESRHPGFIIQRIKPCRTSAGNNRTRITAAAAVALRAAGRNGRRIMSQKQQPPQLLLHHHLKALRLPTILREYPKVADQCARDKADYAQFLLRLSELELLERERKGTERRIKAARFPSTKSLDEFDSVATESCSARRPGWLTP